MNTIQAAWISYLEDVVPSDASIIQVQETKRAFYAGSCGILNLIEKTNVQSDEAACAMMDSFCAELIQFKDDVYAGKE